MEALPYGEVRTHHQLDEPGDGGGKGKSPAKLGGSQAEHGPEVPAKALGR